MTHCGSIWYFIDTETVSKRVSKRSRESSDFCAIQTSFEVFIRARSAVRWDSLVSALVLSVSANVDSRATTKPKIAQRTADCLLKRVRRTRANLDVGSRLGGLALERSGVAATMAAAPETRTPANLRSVRIGPH